METYFSLVYRESSKNYSMLANCSRIFSRQLLISITALDTSRSMVLEPIVFTSLFISCVKNSSLRPCGSWETINLLNCSKWLSSRTSSSVTSQRSASKADSWAIRAGSISMPAVKVFIFSFSFSWNCWTVMDCLVEIDFPSALIPVSYTHLTLPTKA